MGTSHSVYENKNKKRLALWFNITSDVAVGSLTTVLDGDDRFGGRIGIVRKSFRKLARKKRRRRR